MTGLLSSLAQIALLRRDPSGLPSSWAWVAILAFLYAAVDVMILVFDDGYRVVDRTLVDVAFTFAFFWALLAITGRPNRLPQSLAAIFGASALMAPAIAAVLLLRIAAPPGGFVKLLAEAGSVLVTGWYVLVVGHVVRSALDTQLVVGFSLAIVWLLAGFALSQWLFGGLR